MYPILFTIGKVHFYSYGLFAAFSILSVYFVMNKLSIIKNYANKDLFNKVILVSLVGIIGARISYFLVYNNQFSSWYEIFFLWNGGLISYGGMIGGLIAYIVIFRKNLFGWLDILGISFLLGSSIWRIGGYLSGGNPGIISNSFFAINDRIPIVLFESIITLIIFLILYRIYTNKTIKTGLFFWMSVGMYGIIRLFADYFRDYQLSIGMFKLGQVFGLIIFVVSLVAIVSMMMYDKSIRKKNI